MSLTSTEVPVHEAIRQLGFSLDATPALDDNPALKKRSVNIRNIILNSALSLDNLDDYIQDQVQEVIQNEPE